jgi:hypothetical protein
MKLTGESMQKKQAVDSIILRKITEAAHSSSAIEIKYQSMNKNRSKPLWCWIYHHAFGKQRAV